MEIVNAADRSCVERHDYVAFAQAGLFGRAVFFNRNDQHACLERQIIKANDSPMDRHVLAGHADVATSDFSFLNEPASHKFCGVARDRETDSLGWTNHCRVYADHFAG